MTAERGQLPVKFEAAIVALVDILPAVNGQDSNGYATLGGRTC